MQEAFGLSQHGAEWLVDNAGNLESKFFLCFHHNLRAESNTKGKRPEN